MQKYLIISYRQVYRFFIEIADWNKMPQKPPFKFYFELKFMLQVAKDTAILSKTFTYY